MYLHEVMNNKPKGASVNKIGGNRSVGKNLSSTMTAPKFVSRGMTVDK
jgi:hypothetical protein